MIRLAAFAQLVLVLALTNTAFGQALDLAKWQRIKQGMTEAEVVAIMGPPASREKPARNYDKLLYSVVAPKGPLFQKPLAFLLWLNTETGRIDSIENPTCGGLLKAGAPGKPEIFLPQPNSQFGHYPRLLDIRWCPPAGDQPMTYEVAMEVRNIKTEKDNTWTYSPASNVDASDLKTGVPYLNYFFNGAQPGRVRVRGVNSHGAGPWSDYVGFSFSR